jgi:nicotinamidase/pyrazinamidase
MRTLFVDIDTQFDFIMPEGNLHVPGAEKLIPNFIKLVQLAKKYRIRILASADAHTEDDPEFEIFPPHCVKGRKGWEKIAETLLNDHEYLESDDKIDGQDSQMIILEKNKFSMFSNSNMETLLMKLNPNRAVIYGVATDYCVKAAALGMQSRGFEIYVVSDAIAPVDPDKGKEAVKEMELAGVKFIKTDEVENLIMKE